MAGSSPVTGSYARGLVAARELAELTILGNWRGPRAEGGGMASLLRSSGLLGSWMCLIALAHEARAGSPDPRTLRDQLEDQLLDGDRDAEDIAALHLGRQGLPSQAGGHAYVAVQGFTADVAGKRELGAFLVLQAAFGPFRLTGSATLGTGTGRRACASVIGSADLPVPSVPPLFSFPVAPTTRGVFQQVVEAAPKATTPIAVTTDVARSCVRAAWRMLGIADDSRIDSLASRARSSASLPEVRLRAMRTIDESGRLTLTEADPYHYTEAGGATNVLEARLTFRLDRLLFADDEVSLERVRIERSELRSRTAAKVLQMLFEWQRAYSLLQDPTLSSDDHFSAILREVEASAVLDVLTDGWLVVFAPH